jgi:thiol-disulfide isomerase/thioredoxin
MKKIYLFVTAAFLSLGVSAQLQNFSVGETAPNFSATDTHGNSHDLYTYTSQGKYVLIDFFAYWCGPCMATAPKLDAFYKKYGCNALNVIVLGNESDPAGTLATLESFDSQAGINGEDSYPTWIGTEGGSTIGNTFGPAAYPTIVLIGPDNKFISIDVWPISTVADIEAAFPEGVLTPANCSVGLEDTQLNFLLVYPNPSSDVLNVKFGSSLTETITAEIYTLTGQLVSAQTFNQNGAQLQTIDIHSLANGNYLIRLNGTSVKLGKMFSVHH